MRKLIRTFCCVLLIVSLVIPSTVMGVHADGADTVEIAIEVTHGQTEARSMLEYINEFRTSTLGTNDGGGAWYWNEDNSSKTVFNVGGNTVLNELTYDYELEQVAQMRAVEAAVQFSHTRPNGQECFTVYPESVTYKGENLAVGSTTAKSAFIAWREDSEKFILQGHRRNMLSPDYNVIGIGHVVVDGIHFWTHALGYRSSPDTSITAAREDTSIETVEILSGSMTFKNAYTEQSTYSISVGESKAYPTVVAEYAVGKNFPSGRVKCYPSVSWASGNSSIVTSGKDSFTGKGYGTTKLTGTFGTASSPKTVEVAVNVVPTSLSQAVISLEYKEAEYTGGYIKPKVTSITLYGVVLTEGTDYVVKYTNNRNVGSATVTVSGTGSFSGSVSTKFTIKECKHAFDGGTVVTAPSCTAAGQSIYECTKCDYSKKESISATGHSPGAAATCTTPQKCTVCGTQLVPASGKHVDDNANGFCDVCRAIVGIHCSGDVNSDGKISLLDSTVLRRWLAGWDGVTINEPNADVNGDGKVTMLDSIILRRYLAGWSDVELK